MTFFNRKEEVLDVELTQYGKSLLSKGKWKPEYYAFFDDDVIYDVSWASGSVGELQNESEGRIKEAVRLRTQHVFHSVTGPFIPLANSLWSRPEKYFLNHAPLGTAQIGNQQAPAWNITFLKGFVSSSALSEMSSYRPMASIPQINVEIKYETSVEGPENSPGGFRGQEVIVNTGGEEEGTANTGGLTFSDGTSIRTKKDFILLDIEEINGLTKNKDFEVEVFKIGKWLRTDEELLLPLDFAGEQQSSFYEITEDDVLKRKTTQSIRYSSEITDERVDYFLDINTDSGIADEIICSLDPSSKKRSIFSTKFADCEDTGDRERIDIYGPEEEYEDPCEE
jgi:hypothetical protein